MTEEARDKGRQKGTNPGNDVAPAEGSQGKARGNSFGGDDIDAVIQGGITFRGGAKKGPAKQETKVKTKAKKKQYITGAHGSASARKKAEIRQRRANRHKN